MNQNNGEFIDPKGQGMPPPYTDDGPPPPVTVTTHAPHSYPAQPTHPPPVHGVVYPANMGPTVIPVMVTPQMGPKPSPITCRSCNQQIVTRVEYKSSTKTHLFAVLLCLVFWPCVCLPYCLDSCHNADHYCPNCNAYIGSYSN